MAQLKQSTIKDQLTLDLGSDKTSLVMTKGDDGLHPKLSVVPGSNLSSGNGDLEIINESAKAGGDWSGIKFTCSEYTNAFSSYSLKWGRPASGTGFTSLHFTNGLNNQANLGDETAPWNSLYIRNGVLKNTTIKEAFLGDNMQELMTFNSNVAVTPTSGSSLSTDSSEGDITGGFEFNCNHLEKSFTDHGQWTTSKLRLYSDGFPTVCKTILECVDTIPASESASSYYSNTFQIKVNGHTSTTSPNAYGNASVGFDLTPGMPSGSSQKPIYHVSLSAQGYNMYFMCSSGSGSTCIGNSSTFWDASFINTMYTHTLSSPNNTAITVKCPLNPSINSTSSTIGYTLGNSSYKWRYLYAFSGTIQTSDRSAKDSIHYIEDTSVTVQTSTSRKKAKAQSSSNLITTEDVIDFVSNLNPVTFCYKSGQGEDVQATEDNTDPEEIQLGLIADDIKDHKLFKYIGVETTYEEEVSPEVKDDEGNVVTAAVTETKTTLGLQAIPLATAALTACKYLLTKNQELEDRLNAIEAKLDALTSN